MASENAACVRPAGRALSTRLNQGNVGGIPTVATTRRATGGEVI